MYPFSESNEPVPDYVTLFSEEGVRVVHVYLGASVYSYVWDPDDRPESSTAAKQTPEDIRDRVERSCQAAREEHFEDGMESQFSRELTNLINGRGDAAVEALAELIHSNSISEEVAAEALRWLGLMERGPAYSKRRWLLEDCLTNKSVKVRDGAVLGLAFLDDPHAIPYLKDAIRLETRDWIRRGMQQALAQLEDVPCATCLENGAGAQVG